TRNFIRLGWIWILFMTNLPVSAQNDSSLSTIDTSQVIINDRIDYSLLLTPEQKRKRTWLVAGVNVVGYGGTMIALYSAWYSKYDQTSFHTFNDWPEWKQVDKAGHL